MENYHSTDSKMNNYDDTHSMWTKIYNAHEMGNVFKVKKLYRDEKFASNGLVRAKFFFFSYLQISEH